MEYYRKRVKYDYAKSVEIAPVAEALWKSNDNYIMPWIESKKSLTAGEGKFHLYLLLY